MKKICIYFQVHQPLRIKRYRFFDIGSDHYYYDDYLNESIVRRVADNCYLPTNKVLLHIIKEYGCQFKVTFSISGIALEQFEIYAPDVIESFQKLAKTGCVEFLAETYSHSLASLKDKEEFTKQVNEHAEKIKKYFNYTPTVFRNTELIYSDDIGNMVADLGYKAMLTEGAKHILGWKSPNFLYCNAINPRLKILLKNFKLSDDIAFRFSNKGWSEYPLTAEKYVQWLKNLDDKEEIINLFMDYETFGEHQWMDTGIFEFLNNLPKVVFKESNMSFVTPSEAADTLQPISSINVSFPISWADEERDLTAWLGNDLQEDAFNKLYSLSEKVYKCSDEKILKDWKFLQASDHFYYMCTKFFSDGEVHSYFNPYFSPYDAYINYMNVLSDFISRINRTLPEAEKEKELLNLSSIIQDKEKEIEKYKKEIEKLRHLKSKKNKETSKSTKKAVPVSAQKTTAKTAAKKGSVSKKATDAKTSKKTVKAKTITKKK